MYISLPGGDTMLVLSIKDLKKVNSALNLHTNIIYINIYYKRAKPNETYRNHFFPTFSQRNQPKPKMAFCDVVSLHRDSRKMRTIPNSSRRLSPVNLKTLKP